MYKKIVLSLFVFFASLTQAFATTDSISPIGYWKTIDDVTGKPKSIIQIWKTSHDILMGKIIHIYPKPGEDQTKRCDACQGSLHDQPIVGMVILSGLKSESKQWGHGRILDPENGKTYSCSLRMSENGARLNVHGYIGIPLFGRSQTWQRIDQATG